MVLEYRVGWNAGGANPGVTVLHGRSSALGNEQLAAGDLSEAARLLFDGLKAVVPLGITWTFPGEAVDLDVTTGALQAVYTFPPPAPVSATGTAAHAAPAGARIEWRTSAIVLGRRLRGRTFIVPLAAGSYESNGTLIASTITTLTTAANAYLQHVNLLDINPAVWSRTNGVLADATSAVVPDEAAILRSRRD